MKKVMLVLFFMLTLVVAVGCKSNEDDDLSSVEKSHQYDEGDRLELTELEIQEIIQKLDFQEDKAIHSVSTQTTEGDGEKYALKEDITLFLRGEIDYFVGTLEMKASGTYEEKKYEIEVTASTHGNRDFTGEHYTKLKATGMTIQEAFGGEISLGDKFKSPRSMEYYRFYIDVKDNLSEVMEIQVYQKGEKFILKAAVAAEGEGQITILYDKNNVVESAVLSLIYKYGTSEQTRKMIIIYGQSIPTIPGFDDYVLQSE